MIERAERPVSRLELTKWAFLLSQEMPSGGGSAFYDFLPYRYGPFSFVLFREVDGLVRNGYLSETTTDNRRAWIREIDVSGNTGDLPQSVQSDAARVVERFVGRRSQALIDYVYKHFPWYTANSRLDQREQRRVAEAAVYTIGYEGCSVDRVLNVLMQTGIQRIIDVRKNPVARRYGFHKSTLNRICEKLDIEYVHVPEVGIPSELRRHLDSPEAYARLFEEYETKLLPQKTEAVARIAEMVTDRPSALMCMEADPAMCHRSRLADAVSSLTKLSIRHILGKACDLTTS